MSDKVICECAESCTQKLVVCEHQKLLVEPPTVKAAVATGMIEN